MMKKKGLGRGLEVLLGESMDLNSSNQEPLISELKLGQLQRGKYQPRSLMQESGLEDLAQSIKSQGVMQPLLVRAIGDGKYEIIAGERRFRAAKMAGLEIVPVLVKNVDDQAAAAMALIENMQREDLNALEEAQGLARLISEFNYTHENAAQAVGKSRSAVTNLLRLLQLGKGVQAMLMAGNLDMGHARALLVIPTALQIGLAQRVVAQGLSVRETERLANSIVNNNKKNAVGQNSLRSLTKNSVNKDPDLLGLQIRMADLIGLDVEIKPKAKGGEIKIKFTQIDELQALLIKLGLAQ
jgi:ParB family chromosome partitioning protein